MTPCRLQPGWYQSPQPLSGGHSSPGAGAGPAHASSLLRATPLSSRLLRKSPHPQPPNSALFLTTVPHCPLSCCVPGPYHTRPHSSHCRKGAQPLLHPPAASDEVSGCSSSRPALAHLRRPVGATACAGTRGTHSQSPTRRRGDPSTFASRSGVTHMAEGTAHAAGTLAPWHLLRPPLSCVLTGGRVCFLGNHSGVVLSINSREMHSYLVS